MATNQPLRVLVAGAGIGGLTAAIALRQQGHDVTIFEQSRMAQETGAAIHLAPNSNGLLRWLGLQAEDCGAVECLGFSNYAPSGHLRMSIPTGHAAEKWKHPWHLVHRGQLHSALKDRAIADGAKLTLSSRVTSVDAEAATVTFEDGQSVQGDLIVGADGVHSKSRKSIRGGDALTPFDSGKSAFRFLIPTDLLQAGPVTAPAVEKYGYLTMWIGDDRRLVMYPCNNNTMMNFVAIHPSEESANDITGQGGWQELGSKERLLQIYHTLASPVPEILAKADSSKLKVWNLLDMDKVPSFINGKLAVIGDAAHPFLPHQGQGGGQAIEDAVSIATLLPLGTAVEDVPARLALYEKCRYERAHKIQEFTRLAGMDTAELAKLGKTLDMNEYVKYNFRHDEHDASAEVSAEQQAKAPSGSDAPRSAISVA
ncbi:Putative FAD-binding domain, FAD/NAD(P)-binding domain superfamily [Septoria linicola]|uniref:FAD-binding domain, FAD/NAD(P)-binding domain superfamily n=1 Tax=Septoria linicola TaxID=215465 RepID=A0A9Q9ESB7_9PEZI|nr:putative FAD-binding domain, FAD/NAD(P)-binding domain superfamily [Septoria linicola]USW59433.1 Putative FAD-binding domain, FAD/NAD(P)-binding domain superfamily [Septoria linicola]